jgi:hypothetical protein
MAKKQKRPKSIDQAPSMTTVFVHETRGLNREQRRRLKAGETSNTPYVNPFKPRTKGTKKQKRAARRVRNG